MPAEKVNKKYSLFMIPLPLSAMWMLQLAPQNPYVVDPWISISGSDSTEGQRRAQFRTTIHLTVLLEEISTLCPGDAQTAQASRTE